MADWNTAGKVRIVPKGLWKNNVTYEVLDTVYDESKQKYYIAKQTVPSGTLLTNTNYWEIVVDISDVVEAANEAADSATAAASNGVRIDVAQSLSDTQKATARGNISANSLYVSGDTLFVT